MSEITRFSSPEPGNHLMPARRELVGRQAELAQLTHMLTEGSDALTHTRVAEVAGSSGSRARPPSPAISGWPPSHTGPVPPSATRAWCATAIVSSTPRSIGSPSSSSPRTVPERLTSNVDALRATPHSGHCEHSSAASPASSTTGSKTADRRPTVLVRQTGDSRRSSCCRSPTSRWAGNADSQRGLDPSRPGLRNALRQ